MRLSVLRVVWLVTARIRLVAQRGWVGGAFGWARSHLLQEQPVVQRLAEGFELRTLICDGDKVFFITWIVSSVEIREGTERKKRKKGVHT